MNPSVQTEQKKSIMRKYLEQLRASFMDVLLDLVCPCKPRCRFDGKNYHEITSEDVDQIIDGIMSVEHWWFSRKAAQLSLDAYCIAQAKIIIEREKLNRHTYEI